MSEKFTPWFPSSVPPKRRGQYEIRFSPKGDVFTRWWNGLKWCFNEYGASSVFGIEPTGQEQWRGLAFDPKESKP